MSSKSNFSLFWKSPLAFESYVKGPYKYRLTLPFTITLPDAHADTTLALGWKEEMILLRRCTWTRDRIFELKISKGYAWDGCSGPTLDTPDSTMASLVHDALYQLMRESLLAQTARPWADKVFRELLIQNGMSRFRAWVYYLGVRGFAGYAAKVKKEGR